MSEAVTPGENSRLRLITWAPWLTAKQHAFGDRRRFAFALAVEHAHGHDARAEGQAGEAVVVVRGLGDRRGDERAVAVAVVGVGIFGDEVIAFDERDSG